MKILVTGGTGFVGTSVVEAARRAGHTVRALVRDGATLPASDSVTPVPGDALVCEDVARAAHSCDAVVHLVGIKRAAMRRTGLTYEDVDVGSVVTLAAAMKQCGIRRVLLLSAGAIGRSTYVECKAKAERVAIDADLDWTIFRPSFILGPGQQWPILMEPLLALFGMVPGYVGDVARRARCVTREQLAKCMMWALAHDDTIRTVFDVPRIRAFSKTMRSDG